jgi:hypothetical protein
MRRFLNLRIYKESLLVKQTDLVFHFKYQKSPQSSYSNSRGTAAMLCLFLSTGIGKFLISLRKTGTLMCPHTTKISKK